jgi:hypothetical protein
MECKTKYNVGDKFWQMSNNKPTEFTVVVINITHSEDISCYTRIPKTSIVYICYPNSAHWNEQDTFATKEDLIESL